MCSTLIIIKHCSIVTDFYMMNLNNLLLTADTKSRITDNWFLIMSV